MALQLLYSPGYIPQKMRFPARSMKTKDLFSRYPRKISLLKDLQKVDTLSLAALQVHENRQSDLDTLLKYLF